MVLKSKKKRLFFEFSAKYGEMQKCKEFDKMQAWSEEIKMPRQNDAMTKIANTKLHLGLRSAYAKSRFGLETNSSKLYSLFDLKTNHFKPLHVVWCEVTLKLKFLV